MGAQALMFIATILYVLMPGHPDAPLHGIPVRLGGAAIVTALACVA
jgi:hypothetical protein